MKNFVLGLVAAVSLLSIFASCNEEIELIGDFKETPIIYGLLDQSESTHFIKITRAYIGPGNALTYAQIPDSNYFPSVEATITERLDGDVLRTWTLFDTTIFNKSEDGVFYAPEQKLYAFYTGSNDNSDNPTGQDLLEDATYELNVNINNGELYVSGETEIISGISSTQASPNYRFQFAQNANVNGEYKSSSVSVSSGNASILETHLLLKYEDFSGNTSLGEQVVDWNLGEKTVEGTGLQTFVANGETFYQLMHSRASASTQNVTKRNMISITLQITGGSEELNQYIIVNEPSSELAQNKPTFTNLEVTDGHDVIGIFSSRYTFEGEILFFDPTDQFVRCIDKNSTKELCQGPITGLDFFCSQNALDVPESYYCQ